MIKIQNNSREHSKDSSQQVERVKSIIIHHESEQAMIMKMREMLYQGMEQNWDHCMMKTIVHGIDNQTLLVGTLKLVEKDRNCFKSHGESQFFFKCMNSKGGRMKCQYCYGDHKVQDCDIKKVLSKKYMEYKGHCTNCLLPKMREHDPQHYYTAGNRYACLVGSWPVMILRYIGELRAGGSMKGLEYASYQNMKERLKQKYGHINPILLVDEGPQANEANRKWEHRAGEGSFISFWILYYLLKDHWKMMN